MAPTKATSLSPSSETPLLYTRTEICMVCFGTSPETCKVESMPCASNLRSALPGARPASENFPVASVLVASCVPTTEMRTACPRIAASDVASIDPAIAALPLAELDGAPWVHATSAKASTASFTDLRSIGTSQRPGWAPPPLCGNQLRLAVTRCSDPRHGGAGRKCRDGSRIRLPSKRRKARPRIVEQAGGSNSSGRNGKRSGPCGI